MIRRPVVDRLPRPCIPGRLLMPDYYRELRGHWLHCAHQARRAAILAIVTGDLLKGRKMRSDQRVAVRHARSVNRALVRMLRGAHTQLAK